MSHSADFIRAVDETNMLIDHESIELLVQHLVDLRDRDGRLFVLGVGGSAGNASHMVNDLRKLCGIEAYAPTDNVPELTARANDEGFDTVFEEYLKVSKFTASDAIFVLSVGGGNKHKKVSVCLCNAMDYVQSEMGTIFSIIGRNDGMAALVSDAMVIIPAPHPEWVTPLSEAFQAIVWHCIVSHPRLQKNRTKW